MANWLLDYIEMTEYIPSELREQLTSIRELDLQVHNAIDELEKDIKIFFSKVNSLSQQERQDQFDAFLKKCDVATQAASDKVKVADKLHDLVEKSMRLLDQGLEKLKEDLLEGDKAYIVEDLERRSQELDEQLKLEHQTMLQRQQNRLHDLGEGHSKGVHKNIDNEINHSIHHNDHLHNNNNQQSHHQSNHHHHRQSLPAQSSINHHHNQQHHHHNMTNTNHRSRNNSTGALNPVGRQKKRERKRLNSTMTIFNRNSRTVDDYSNISNQTFLSSPLTPDYLTGLQNSNSSLNDVITGGNNGSLTTMKGMMAGNKSSTGINDKSNGNDPSARAKQPILTAIDAAHAVSPNATNSDKLVLVSSNANGDIYKPANVITTAPTTIASSNTIPTSANATTHINNDVNNKQLNHSANHHLTNANQLQHPAYQNQLSSHLLSKVTGFHSGDNKLSNNPAISKNERHNMNHHDNTSANQRLDVSPFSALPLSSRHDPIMVAASQAISATQNMTPGRRTSSLKASYAAVSSGRSLHTAPNKQQLFNDQGGKIYEVYCKCRSHIQDSSMIACDNSKCKIEWFHYECVGITSAPEGEWYCDDCRVSKGIQKSGNNKQAKIEGVNVT